ncbi:MAG TPA: dihydroxyacetone kinase phosphoryl donor subunit DhaM [Pseudonocardiaceae bacterium]|nr:dihydroxyacetone kinase phosphoryl donor subunit DhaM [Pseudonocardiaceae bacterium]
MPAGPVALVVVSHSARLAEGVAELAAQMAPDVPIKPAGGLPDGGIGTDYGAVLAACEQADAGAGVVLLYDLGSARMTAELVVESLAEPDRAVVADGPLVEGAVAAAVAAAGGADLAAVVAAASGAEPGSVAAPAGADGEHTVELELTNDVGLHARPAAVLVRTIAGLDAEVSVRHGEQQADARSVLALLGLAAAKGDRLVVSARGPDAATAVDRISALIRTDFHG